MRAIVRFFRSWCAIALPLAFLLAAILATGGCSRQPVAHGSGPGNSPEANLPFHSDADASASAAGAKNQAQESSLPFDENNAGSLPAGTLLTVRLENAVSCGKDEQQGFAAAIDSPVVIEGNTLVPRGASARGRIESARASENRHGSYVRMTLDSISLGGHQIPLATSSLFVHGIADPTPSFSPTAAKQPGEMSASPIQLSKGRRLTFRLTSAASFRQLPAPSYSEGSSDKSPSPTSENSPHPTQ